MSETARTRPVSTSGPPRLDLEAATDRVLAGTGEPGLAELRRALAEMLDGEALDGRLVEQEAIKKRVYRLRFATADGERSFVVKRLKPEVAQRNELVARRWLPAVGLGDAGPPLAAVASARAGGWVWHVYDDLDEFAVAAGEPAGGPVVEALLDLLVELHVRFAGHPLLAECRLWGGDLGMPFYAASVRDACAVLTAIAADGAVADPDDAAVVERLACRLELLEGETGWRAAAMAEHAGRETLLHGDLWTTNAMVNTARGDCRARLIDWDHAAVGPVAYDLCTLLLRFEPADRPAVLDGYRERFARSGGALPAPSELELLFETTELARLANSAIWPAIAVWEEGPRWGFELLAAIDGWLAELEPVLGQSH